MAAPPRFKLLTIEDYPGIPKELEPLLGVLNDTLSALTNALTKGLTRTENIQGGAAVGKEFKTAASIDETWPVLLKHALPVKPSHLSITKLSKSDGSAVTSAWSYTWDLQDPDLFAIRFQGLSSSTSYRFNATYE